MNRPNDDHMLIKVTNRMAPNQEQKNRPAGTVIKVLHQLFERLPRILIRLLSNPTYLMPRSSSYCSDSKIGTDQTAIASDGVVVLLNNDPHHYKNGMLIVFGFRYWSCLAGNDPDELDLTPDRIVSGSLIHHLQSKGPQQ